MKRIGLFALLFVFGTAFAETTVCYSTNTEVCRTPVSTNVLPDREVVLPAGLTFFSDEPRTTTFVILPDGLTWATVEVTGSAQALTVAGNIITLVGDGGQWALTRLSIAGATRIGQAVTARVIVNNPNRGVSVLDIEVDIALVIGVDNRVITTLNPASNTAQAMFIRLVNPNANEVLVSLAPTDDTGTAGGDVVVTLAPRSGLQLTSSDLESGNDAKPIDGAFGVGAGKWWVRMNADGNIMVQVFVRNPETGALAEVGGVVDLD